MKEPQITVIGYAEIIQETQRFINKHLWAVGGCRCWLLLQVISKRVA
ncbi:MAG: hypothetical protein R2822_19050 [Spirosomataceae bacterium]